MASTVAAAQGAVAAGLSRDLNGKRRGEQNGTEEVEIYNSRAKESPNSQNPNVQLIKFEELLNRLHANTFRDVVSQDMDQGIAPLFSAMEVNLEYLRQIFSATLGEFESYGSSFSSGESTADYLAQSSSASSLERVINNDILINARNGFKKIKEEILKAVRELISKIKDLMEEVLEAYERLTKLEEAKVREINELIQELNSKLFGIDSKIGSLGKLPEGLKVEEAGGLTAAL